jgi:tryptophan-rich sensory protein
MKVSVREALVLGAFLLLCLMAGALGAVATASSVHSWYVTLQKPSWTPPGSLFGPVWTLLYGMMAWAAWLVWMKRQQRPIRLPLGIFFCQLAINASWSWIFFGLRRPDLGFFWIGFLWVWILATLFLFLTVRPLAAVLLVPYLLWVTFAQVLNYEIYRLN